ncbi:hypothetical protein BJ912DRAFT_1045753 [Pholiota molesta]|nr:hypothetical protein BJ912DRAFT_1045753 [Pholiota molesta]
MTCITNMFWGRPKLQRIYLKKEGASTRVDLGTSNPSDLIFPLADGVLLLPRKYPIMTSPMIPTIQCTSQKDLRLLPISNLYQNDILKTVIAQKLELGINSISEISSLRILWAFYISPVKDRNGADALPPIDNFLGGLVVHPAPFVYNLTPRKEGTRTIILEEWAKAEEEAAMWL